MNPGKLRHQVIVEQPGPPTIDSFRQPVPTWTTIGTYRANVRPLAGREKAVADTLQASVTHHVTMRYNPDYSLDASFRLIFLDGLRGNRTLRILSVTSVDEVYREWSIEAQEITVNAPPP